LQRLIRPEAHGMQLN